MSTSLEEHFPRELRVLMAICLFVAMLVAPISMMFLLYFYDPANPNVLVELIRDDPQAWLGIPWAGGAALIVVLLFKPIFGDMEFKVWEFEFKGSSGPVVLWVMSFLAEIAGIVALYKAGR